jgi:hypothetical protein
MWSFLSELLKHWDALAGTIAVVWSAWQQRQLRGVKRVIRESIPPPVGDGQEGP